MPAFQYRVVFKMVRQVKGFFNLEFGLTRGPVSSGQRHIVEWESGSASNLAEARLRIREQQQMLEHKDQKICQLEARVAAGSASTDGQPERQKALDNAGTAMTLPGFIIIGAQRCGTTYLYNLMCNHSLIEPAKKKEVHFFDRNYHKGERWYRSHFYLSKQEPRLGILTGEATPYYLYHPHAPKRAAQIVPAAKLITLLRNPVDRAYSNYHQEVSRGREHLSFEEAIEAEQSRLQGELKKMLADESYASRKHQLLSYVSRGIYVDQIIEWHKFFGWDQLLVLKSEDFFEHQQDTLNRIFAFLDLPEQELDTSQKQKLNLKMRNEGDYTPMAATTRQRLEQFFEPHNQRLYEYLGEDFGW